MNIKNRFLDFFKSKGISQRELSRVTGHSESMVGRYLAKPNFNFIMGITKFYPDINWNYILKGEKENYKYQPETENLLDAIDSLTKQLRNLS